MPVARIISSSFEDALKMSEHLRSRFDTIEIAAPGRVGDIAADLEITLETCSVEQAMEQVAAAPDDVAVVVAPGAIAPVKEAEPVFEEQLEQHQPPVTSRDAEQSVDAIAATTEVAHSGNGHGGREYAENSVAEASTEPVHEAPREEPATQLQSPPESTFASDVPTVEYTPSVPQRTPRKRWMAGVWESMHKWSEQRAVARQMRFAERQRELDEETRKRQAALEARLRLRREEAERLAAIRAEEQERMARQDVERQGRKEIEAERLAAIAERRRRELDAQREADRQAQAETERAALARQAEQERLEREQTERVRRQEEEERARLAEIAERRHQEAEAQRQLEAQRERERQAVIAASLEQQRREEQAHRAAEMERKREEAERERAVALAAERHAQQERAAQEAMRRAQRERAAREAEVRRRAQIDAERAAKLAARERKIAMAAAARQAARLSARQSGEVHQPSMRVATGAAAVVAILLTAGWMAYANRRPASPLPESTLQQSNSIQEQVPFGPAKLAPAKASAFVPVTAAAATATKPSAKVAKRRRVRMNDTDVDYVSEDVTVRHFNRKSRSARPRSTSSAAPSGPTVAARAKSDVKQISDMD